MKKFLINVNGVSYNVEVEEIDAGTVAVSPVAAPAAPVKAAEHQPAAPVAPVAETATKTAPATQGTHINSPMPGNIWEVKTTVGATVSEGDELFILEAMKMENEILAPVSGKVVSIEVAKGAAVDSGTLLAVIS